MVAPLVGAWIETIQAQQKLLADMSLPSWERGLKLPQYLQDSLCNWSLPSWERGLKQIIVIQ